MSTIDSKILRFIAKHHVMTLATSMDNHAYCANLFYAWSQALQGFVLTTEQTTRHGAEVAANPAVAGSIVLETKIIGKVQGLQFCGTMHCVKVLPVDVSVTARKEYLGRFPYAAVMELELWVLYPTFMKLTDNTLGFGTKLIWQKDVQ